MKTMITFAEQLKGKTDKYEQQQEEIFLTLFQCRAWTIVGHAIFFIILFAALIGIGITIVH